MEEGTTDLCVSLFVFREPLVVRSAFVATVHVTSLRERRHFLVIESTNLRSEKLVNQHDGSAQSEQHINEFCKSSDVIGTDVDNLTTALNTTKTEQNTTNRGLILHQRTRQCFCQAT